MALIAHLSTVLPIDALARTLDRESSTQVAQQPVTSPAPPPPPAVPVRVNRTVPKVTAPSARPTFSAHPSDAEITNARIFGEPLVAIGRGTLPGENRALVDAVNRYLDAHNPEQLLPFLGFLKTYPDSPWRPSLLLNLGWVYRHTGYFTRALDVWEQTWQATKTSTDLAARAIGDRALGELVELNARLGRFERLETLFADTKGRVVSGHATEQVSGAREGLWMMRNTPEKAFLCGPLAVDSLLAATRAGYVRDQRIRDAKSTPQGTSLAQMQTLAAELNLPLQMVHRSPGAPVLLPAVVHWKAGHFAALIRETDGRFLVRDPTFGDELWVSRTALDEEATGYMLVRPQDVPAGWRVIDASEGERVWGKGMTDGQQPNNTRNKDPKTQEPCESKGMPTSSVHLMVVSLHMSDVPIGYAPPRGPSVKFEITYNQREANQPSAFSFSNLGPKWTFDWLSYVQDDPTNSFATAYLAVRGGGQDSFQGYDDSTHAYQPAQHGGAALVRTASTPIRYEHRLSDGSVEVFAQPDGASTLPRRVFMTEWRDPYGNGLTFTYDAQLRLVAATDAIGQVTTLSYEHPSDSRKITRVTDPFGRTATFDYDEQGRLAHATDMIGLQSGFTYDAGDFITALTTPYGVTKYAKGENGQDRWLEATDALGAMQRVEYKSDSTVEPTEAPERVPAGFDLTNNYLNYRNTFFWNKRAMAVAPRDPRSAHIYHWLHTGGPINQTSGTLESEKPPLEGRIWYRYPGQPHSYDEGTLDSPTVVARVLDDGSTQARQATYNAIGHVTQSIDPRGRTTTATYATNGIDLLEVHQLNGPLFDRLASLTYDAHHLPLTFTDSAGQTVTYTYNPSGQLLTTTAPPRTGITENRTTTYVYDSDGYLQTLTGPATGLTTTYAYDAYGRLASSTDLDGYTVTHEYDAFDREIKTTYPDGTFEAAVYNRLDLERRRDRLGRWSSFLYDPMRRQVAIRDSLGQTVSLEWCTCGTLDRLIDAGGNATSWEHDLQGRVTKATRADGTTTTLMYETWSDRLKETEDSKLQLTTIDYYVDGTWKSISHSNTAVPMPVTTFTYDPVYERLATMTDGNGTTTYSYYPITSSPALGAGQLQSVDGPWANDTVTYSYDELGRVVGRDINGVSRSDSFDALGRLTGETNALGAFTYGYDGVTNRLVNIGYPNGQTTLLSYLPTNQEHRLADIHNKLTGATTLSRFQFGYAPDGTVTTWSQQMDADPARMYTFEHDGVNRLISATLKTTDATPVTVKRYGYSYDKNANRVGEQIDDGSSSATVNALNALTGTQSGGLVRFAGTVSEAATVAVQGTPAQVSPTNEFTGSAVLGTGTNTVSIAATDASGNTRTNNYSVTQPVLARTLTYDAEGDVLSDGSRTFEWDGANRLAAINQGTHRSEFGYDGWGHRVSIIEKEANVVTNERRFLWCGMSPCEERDASGGTVTRRFFPQGVQEGGAAYYFTMDHLGSVREMTDSAGAVRARYDYDPYGRVTKLSGDKDSPFTFTGHLQHSPSGLLLATHRAYDPELGRWISPDPIGVSGGTNTYAYVGGLPTDTRDPQGLLLPAAAAVGAGLLFGAGVVSALSPPGLAIIATAAALTATIAVANEGYQWWRRHHPPPLDPQSAYEDDDMSMATAMAAQKSGSPPTRYGPKPVRTPAEEAQATAERNTYKKRCETKPPDTCSDCDKARYNVLRWRDCARMRQDWDDRWWKYRHEIAIQDAINNANDAEDYVRKHCP